MLCVLGSRNFFVNLGGHAAADRSTLEETWLQRPGLKNAQRDAGVILAQVWGLLEDNGDKVEIEGPLSETLSDWQPGGRGGLTQFH